MTLAPLDLFARVIAAFPRLVGRFHRLTVHNGGGRRDVAPLGFPEPIAQCVVDERPGPILAPSPKVAINGLPRAEITRQQPPRTAGAYLIKDGIDQAATVELERSATLCFSRFGSGNQRLDLVPFFISQIRWITSWMRLHPSHL